MVPVTMASKLCFQLRDAVIMRWKDGQLLQEANDRRYPQSANTDEGGDVRPVNLHRVFVEYGINQPEHIDHFDEDNPHCNPCDDIEVALGVA